MSIFASVFNGLGSMFSGRSKRKSDQKAMDFQRKMMEMEMANQRRLAEADRRWQLEDRRYRQEAVSPYRKFSGFNAGSPEYSDTTPSPIDLPQGVPPSERPRNHNQGLMYFR
jgi:hypothetical protein